MKAKLVISLFLLAGLVVFGCSGVKPAGYGAGTPPPVITQYFSPVDRGPYGNTIFIYLAAEDPVGDMERIAVQVTQVGYGFYPASFTYVKPNHQKKFVGYLQWNTFGEADSLPEWTNITMNITVMDRYGQQSNAVVVPYQFASGSFSNRPLPSPFNQGRMFRLGYIDIDLVNPEAPTPGGGR